MDGALILGDWMPLEHSGYEVVIDAGGDRRVYSCGAVIPDEIISRISDFVTLKTGDVIAIALSGDFALVMGEKVRVSVDDRDMLSFSVR